MNETSPLLQENEELHNKPLEILNIDKIPCQEISDPAVRAMEPVISVAMITYNHEPYIAQAIDGVLQQETSFPLELVIGEDCSTDRTRQIVFDYQRKHPAVIRVLVSENNVGGCRNVVRVEAACRGKYVAFCEGDDYWHDTHKLQRQVAFLEENADYGMVHSGYRIHHTQTGTITQAKMAAACDFHDEDAYLELLARRRRIRTLTVVVKRDILQRVIAENPECRDERYLLGDFQRWLEISRVTKVKCIPDCLATYNVLHHSATQHSSAAARLRFQLSVKKLISHYLQKYPCPDEIRTRRLYSHSIRVLSTAFYAVDTQTVATEMRALFELRKGIPLKCRYYSLISRWNWMHGLFVEIHERTVHAIGGFLTKRHAMTKTMLRTVQSRVGP